MIVILTQASYEPTTELVMEWLQARGYTVERVNADDINGEQPFALELDGAGLRAMLAIDGRRIEMAEVSAVWFRRWRLDTEPDYSGAFDKADCEILNLCDYREHLQGEFRTLSGAFFSAISHAKWLGESSAYRYVNKLIVLRAASRAGLAIPPSIVTGSIETVRRFEAQHGALIVKPLSNLLMLTRDDRLYMSYTSDAPLASDGDGWSGGLPSLFQKKLSKRYELRCFYMDGMCFTMATIAAAPEYSSKVDWRQLQSFSVARRVPYKLPGQIEQSIHTLMRELGLDTGSIDLICTTSGDIVFLEVNPGGQFGMVSGPCNYNLEEHIAEALIRRSHSDEQKACRAHVAHHEIC